MDISGASSPFNFKNGNELDIGFFLIFLTRVSDTNMGLDVFFVFFFVLDRLNIDHYLTTSSSIDSKFHGLHRYIVEIGKRIEH